MIRYDENLNKFGIKLLNDRTVRKTAQFGNKEHFECMRAILQHFIKYPDPMVVPVYGFEILESAPGPFGMTKYQYDMKRLGLLNEEEKILINYLYDENKGWSMTPEKKKLLESLRSKYPNLSDFVKKIFEPRRYWDIHEGNFLKDEEENYLIIDLEGFVNPPLSKEENNWIIR